MELKQELGTREVEIKKSSLITRRTDGPVEGLSLFNLILLVSFSEPKEQ